MSTDKNVVQLVTATDQDKGAALDVVQQALSGILDAQEEGQEAPTEVVVTMRYKGGGIETMSSTDDLAITLGMLEVAKSHALAEYSVEDEDLD